MQNLKRMPEKMVELRVMGVLRCSDWLIRQLEVRFAGLLLHGFLAYEMQVQHAFHLFATRNKINQLNILPISFAGKTQVVVVGAAEIWSALMPL